MTLLELSLDYERKHARAVQLCPIGSGGTDEERARQRLEYEIALDASADAWMRFQDARRQHIGPVSLSATA